MSDVLLIDIGNSSIKWWLERDGAVIVEGRSAATVDALAVSLGDLTQSVGEAALASVANPEDDQRYVERVAAITGARVHCCHTEASALGVTNSYSNPQGMGVDRWLAMLGAWRVDSGPLCVVDAGTAVTIDLVAADGRHEGGYIIPGPRLMQESLSSRTQRIDVGATDRVSVQPGQSTAECVSSGAWLAASGALHDVVRRHPDHRVVVCGGDGQALLGLGFNAEWRPGLVREGLSRWLHAQLGTEAAG